MKTTYQVVRAVVLLAFMTYIAVLGFGTWGAWELGQTIERKIKEGRLK